MVASIREPVLVIASFFACILARNGLVIIKQVTVVRSIIRLSGESVGTRVPSFRPSPEML